MRARWWIGLAAAVVALLCAGGRGPWAAPDDVTVVLELSQGFYYEGDPILVRVSVRNRGPATVDNPVAMRLLAGLKVRQAGGSRLRPASSGEVSEPNRPDQLKPESFYGSVIDISGMFPQTLKAGRYELLWEGDGLRSKLVAARVLPRYDPQADYVGEIVTSLGTIRLDLFEQRSPIAVKAFVDLARSGFYDGLGIDEVRQDQFIAGGTEAAGPRRFAFPAEQSTLPLVRGSVILQPTEATPPANGSGFMILLAPQPAWAGQVTVLGEVLQGLETAGGLSRVPSSGAEGEAPFRPLSPIKIEKVLISEQNSDVGELEQGHGEPPGGDQQFVDLSWGSPYIQTH